MKQEQKEISLKTAVILFSLVLIWIISGILLYKIPIVTLLFISTVAIALFSSVYLKHSLEKILNDMGESVSRAMQGIFFFFLIGMAIAVWMRCGALPAIIYYGVGWLSPKFFLPTVFILASLVGISTGSAWTTAATAGVISIGNFKPLEFEGFIRASGANAFTLSPMKWVNSTNENNWENNWGQTYTFDIMPCFHKN